MQENRNHRPPRQIRFLTLGLVLLCAVMVISASITWLAVSSTPIAAQEPMPTGLSPEAQAWIETVDQQRALNIPAEVRTFTDLRAFLQQPGVVVGQSVSSTLALTPREMGSVSIISGPGPCNPDDGETCYDLQVSCNQTTREFQVTAKVGEPSPGSTHQGTYIMSGGFDGTYYWEDGGSLGGGVIAQLHDAGLRTVQLDWNSDWRQGAAAANEGLEDLNCAWATVAKWVYNSLHDSSKAYCAAGHSNGATQVGFGLVQYGLSGLFDAVVFEGGPNYVRSDIGCLDTVSPLYYPKGERRVINRSYGLGTGSGACVDNDVALESRFQESSLSYDTWPYSYPDTSISFVFGISDTTDTAVHGLFFHNHLQTKGTPTMSLQVITGTGHFVIGTPQGAQAMVDTFINECVLRHAPPAITLTTTIGTDPGNCASTSAITVQTGADVTYCYQVENTAGITFTLHDLAATEIGAILSGSSYTLMPGDKVSITHTITASPSAILQTMVTTATWTAYNAGPTASAMAVDTTTVTIRPYYVYLPSIQR